MIAYLSLWVKEVILVVLFATFIEILLPSSSMQRFVRVIMGLFIMLAILNPAIDVLQNRLLPEQVPALSMVTGGADIDKTSKNVAADRDRLASEIYRKDLARQIRALVMAIEGVAEARVTVELQNKVEGKYSGAIEKVVVFVKSGIANSSSIPKVTIGPEHTMAEELSPAVKEKIKRTVAELYQIRQHQIEIKRMG